MRLVFTDRARFSKVPKNNSHGGKSMSVLERFQKAIKENDDKELNRISHELMAKDEELEDQGLTDFEMNHVIGACMRTNFPNMDNDMKSPY